MKGIVAFLLLSATVYGASDSLGNYLSQSGYCSAPLFHPANYYHLRIRSNGNVGSLFIDTGAPETLNLLDDPRIQRRSAVACARGAGFGDARAHAFGDERALAPATMAGAYAVGMTLVAVIHHLSAKKASTDEEKEF